MPSAPPRRPEMSVYRTTLNPNSPKPAPSQGATAAAQELSAIRTSQRHTKVYAGCLPIHSPTTPIARICLNSPESD